MINERIFCGNREVGCGSEITECDREAGFCTQCTTPLVAPGFPLEHQLLLSLTQAQSRRDAEAK